MIRFPHSDDCPDVVLLWHVQLLVKTDTDLYSLAKANTTVSSLEVCYACRLFGNELTMVMDWNRKLS